MRKSLGEVTLIVSVAEKCFQITKDAVREVPDGLTCSHEEADTRLAPSHHGRRKIFEDFCKLKDCGNMKEEDEMEIVPDKDGSDSDDDVE